jgi:glycosyltransferase involved in cell wall biosynthesis
MFKKKSMRTLFYDIEISGHHTEYIKYIADYVANLKAELQCIFLVHPSFLSIIDTSPYVDSNVTFIPITQTDYETIHKKGGVRGQHEQLTLIENYALKLQVDNVFVLTLDHIQKALIFHKTKIDIKGIFFGSFIWLKDEYWFKFLIKKMLMRGMLKNNRIKNIFIPNDHYSTSELNRIFKREALFLYNVDPIPLIYPIDTFNVYQKYNISPGRKILFHFGSLSGRKGTEELIESVRHMDDDLRSQLAILILGKTYPDYSAHLLSKINVIKKRFPNTEIIFENVFLMDREMKTILSQCFCVVLPYKRTFSSSGIIGHAAASAKLIIGPSSGLIGRLILENNLGITIDKITPYNVAKAIDKIVSHNTSAIYNEVFVESKNPSIFAKNIIDNILETN